MKDVQKMKRERQKIVEEMRSITATAEVRADHKMTEQEAAKWQELDGQAANMAEEIKRAERMNELELEGAGKDDSGDSKEDVRTEKKFGSFGEFLQAVRAACIPGGRKDERLEEVRAASGLGETVPGDGGYLVQADMLSEIMKRAYDISAIANRCRKVQIGANANRLQWLSIDETSRATGSRWGGVRGYWAAEASTVSATHPKMKRQSLELEKLMAFVYMTEELLQDSTGMQSIAYQAVAEEFGWLLDEAIVNGTGSGQPLGWMNSDALVSVAKEAGQPAATIVYENVLKMWARMWARSKSNSVWFINQDIMPQLGTMALVVGAGGVPVYLPASGASGSPYGTLFGRPVVEVEQAKTLGTAGDINLVDPSQYILIEKGGIQQAASIHVRFLYDEQTFRFTYRVNGQPTWDSPLTPANGASNTVSPFVTLAVRA